MKADDSIYWFFGILGMIIVGGGSVIVYNRQTVINKIVTESNLQGVDENLALAIAEQESNFIQKPARDFATTGSWGIFQLEPGSASDMAGRSITPSIDFKGNPDLDIQLGVKYIKWLMGLLKNNEAVIQAFNEGIGNYLKGKQDLAYLAKVSELYNSWVG